MQYLFVVVFRLVENNDRVYMVFPNAENMQSIAYNTWTYFKDRSSIQIQLGMFICEIVQKTLADRYQDWHSTSQRQLRLTIEAHTRERRDRFFFRSTRKKPLRVPISWRVCKVWDSGWQTSSSHTLQTHRFPRVNRQSMGQYGLAAAVPYFVNTP
jgi:hypothetical protein